MGTTQYRERVSRDLTLLYRKEENGIWLDGMDSRMPEVVIPDHIDGLPVVGIYKKAFF